MPISKEAAHARAVKAAATRARNKANGVAPAFPQSYHATPTRHVTRDLRMKQTVKQPKQTRIALRDIRKADTQALRGAYNQMNAGGWKWGRGDDTRYYAIKEELRAREWEQCAYVSAYRCARHRREEAQEAPGQARHWHA